MTLNKIAAPLFEPRGTRYIGRHRAPEESRIVAVAVVPRQLTPTSTFPATAD